MITPKDLDGINLDSIQADDRQALIDFIDHRLMDDPKSFGYHIFAVGILSNNNGWEEVAKSVLKEYESVGWIISDIMIFYSFRTRVEFNIFKR